MGSARDPVLRRSKSEARSRFGKAKILEIGGTKALMHGGAAAVEKEYLVAGEAHSRAAACRARLQRPRSPQRSGRPRQIPRPSARRSQGLGSRQCWSATMLRFHAASEYRPASEHTSAENRAGIKTGNKNCAAHSCALLSPNSPRAGYEISNWLMTTLLPNGTEPVHATPAPPKLLGAMVAFERQRF